MHTLQVPDISHWLEAGGSTSLKTLKISMLLWKVLELKKKHPLAKGYLSGKTLTFITVFQMPIKEEMITNYLCLKQSCGKQEKKMEDL